LIERDLLVLSGGLKIELVGALITKLTRPLSPRPSGPRAVSRPSR
jgi:hypothetical protein